MTTILNSQEAGLVARRVSIDEYLVAIPCLMNPRERWNGWACPYFGAGAVAVLRDKMAQDDYYRLEVDGDLVTLVDMREDADEEFRRDEIEAVLIDGVKFWSVGSWGWVWSDDDEDNCPNAKDYAPCAVEGCDHDPEAVAREVERWEEISDQALWITMLTLDIVGESSSLQALDASNEIARRYGPDATEWSAQLFTDSKCDGADMLRTVTKDWAWFDRSARVATRNIRHQAIIRAMTQALEAEGIPCTVEYPDYVQFTAPSGLEWATGGNGWHYATDVEGMGDSVGIAAEEADLDSMTPEQIAAAWVALIQKG